MKFWKQNQDKRGAENSRGTSIIAHRLEDSVSVWNIDGLNTSMLLPNDQLQVGLKSYKTGNEVTWKCTVSYLEKQTYHPRAEVLTSSGGYFTDAKMPESLEIGKPLTFSDVTQPGDFGRQETGLDLNRDGHYVHAIEWSRDLSKFNQPVIAKPQRQEKTMIKKMNRMH
ncbi:hypothetical protein CL622_07735 [archaeon]|nr:hypothetical protein [archaeon]|tara:strand:- start:190 stop:693 length:504 start_codon:yes stop_codon:yes gene_type:complete